MTMTMLGRTMILTTTPDNDDDVTDCDNNEDHVTDHDDQDNDLDDHDSDHDDQDNDFGEHDDQDNDFDDHDDQDTLECSLQTVLPHRDQLARRVFMFRSRQSTITGLQCWR